MYNKREYGGERRRDEIDREVKEVIDKIRGLKNFAEYNIEDFSKEDGDADRVAKALARSIKASQLRRFYGYAKEIEERLSKEESWDKVDAKFWMLQPQLAYAKGRNVINDDFYQLMTSCLNKVGKEPDEEARKKSYARFMKFFEAIVAYHRYYRKGD